MSLVPSTVFDNMEWSYSRLKTFEACKYQWYLKYIDKSDNSRKELFFSNYGKFVHSLLADYFSGRKTRMQIEIEYLTKYRKMVDGIAPSVKIYNDYFNHAIEYLREATIPVDTVLEVEKRHKFQIENYKFVGIIDLAGTDEDGNIIILDNKSRNILPRVAKKKMTKRNRELKEFLRQLYIYSIPVFNEYGKYPSRLQFNCFRFNRIVDEPFVMKDFEESKQWACDLIESIKTEDEFPAKVEYFKCNFLCDVCDQCEYFQMSEEVRHATGF